MDIHHLLDVIITKWVAISNKMMPLRQLFQGFNIKTSLMLPSTEDRSKQVLRRSQLELVH